jgi:hypothetical protein
VSGRLSPLGTQSDARHERVAGATEGERVISIVEVIVIIDPFDGNLEFEHRHRRRHGGFLVGGPSRSQTITNPRDWVINA